MTRSNGLWADASGSTSAWDVAAVVLASMNLGSFRIRDFNGEDKVQSQSYHENYNSHPEEKSTTTTTKTATIRSTVPNEIVQRVWSSVSTMISKTESIRFSSKGSVFPTGEKSEASSRWAILLRDLFPDFAPHVSQREGCGILPESNGLVHTRIRGNDRSSSCQHFHPIRVDGHVVTWAELLFVVVMFVRAVREYWPKGQRRVVVVQKTNETKKESNGTGPTTTTTTTGNVFEILCFVMRLCLYLLLLPCFVQTTYRFVPPPKPNGLWRFWTAVWSRDEAEATTSTSTTTTFITSQRTVAPVEFVLQWLWSVVREWNLDTVFNRFRRARNAAAVRLMTRVAVMAVRRPVAFVANAKHACRWILWGRQTLPFVGKFKKGVHHVRDFRSKTLQRQRSLRADAAWDSLVGPSKCLAKVARSNSLRKLQKQLSETKLEIERKEEKEHHHRHRTTMKVVLVLREQQKRLPLKQSHLLPPLPPSKNRAKAKAQPLTLSLPPLPPPKPSNDLVPWRVQEKLRAEACLAKHIRRRREHLVATASVAASCFKLPPRLPPEELSSIQRELELIRRRRRTFTFTTLLLRPDTTFAVTWKVLTVLCVVAEIASEIGKRTTGTAGWSPGCTTLGYDGSLTRTLTLLTLLYETVRFLDVVITFFTGEFRTVVGSSGDSGESSSSSSSTTAQRRVLVPKPWANRWLVPGVGWQLLVNPTLQRVLFVFLPRVRVTHVHAVVVLLSVAVRMYSD